MAKKKTEPKVTEVTFQDVPETGAEPMEITAEEAAENMVTTVEPATVTKRADIKPIEPHAALATYPKEEQEKILCSADRSYAVGHS